MSHFAPNGPARASGPVQRYAKAPATLIPMVRGLTGDAPYMPPLVHGSFAAAAVGLAVTDPA